MRRFTAFMWVVAGFLLALATFWIRTGRTFQGARGPSDRAVNQASHASQASHVPSESPWPLPSGVAAPAEPSRDPIQSDVTPEIMGMPKTSSARHAGRAWDASFFTRLAHATVGHRVEIHLADGPAAIGRIEHLN